MPKKPVNGSKDLLKKDLIIGIISKRTGTLTISVPLRVIRKLWQAKALIKEYIRHRRDSD